jgi:hypothetical protein
MAKRACWILRETSWESFLSKVLLAIYQSKRYLRESSSVSSSIFLALAGPEEWRFFPALSKNKISKPSTLSGPTFLHGFH